MSNKSVQSDQKKKKDVTPPFAGGTGNALPDREELWKEKYLRALADYQNLEKRVRAEAGLVRIQAEARLVAELLPALENLYLAEIHLKDRGLSLAITDLMRVLESRGVVRFWPEKTVFDPVTMECIEVTDGTANEVTGVVSAGYSLNGKLITPAKVKVGGVKMPPEDGAGG